METENNKQVPTEPLFLTKVENLEKEIQELKAQNQNLKDQLNSKILQEQQLALANYSLQTEIIDRQQTEAALRLLLEKLASEKNDLELILDTTTTHSDTIEALLYDKALSLAREVTIDGLTQISNRRAFDQRLVTEWQRLARECAPLSLLLCDVDFFKRFNDRYGHPAGDTCLKAVAKAIETCIRRPADLAARYGGEEFAVILPSTQKEGAIYIAEQICQAVNDLQIPHEASYISGYVSLSIGVSTIFPERQIDPKVLVEAADKGLYLAKNQGRDRAIFSNP
ncbi:diguanylate cyclase [Pseudanabaena yagii]|uniref:Diguanylate cyclase n=1 Tax=Pseudanabaena yagii GIHE-NHR1 TaxID=2722753 RepID=A0ABX1LUX4_9CYAN|nr:diguanylate cyclase [Pseudanabaena yagii]NMF59973.1 diguanylate cyclase [Pseudanabaena yagii GIHE-NHR1]